MRLSAQTQAADNCGGAGQRACNYGTSNAGSSATNSAARTEAIATGVMTLIDLFSKSPEEEAREAEARAEYARREAARRTEQARQEQQRAQEQRDAEDLFASMGRNNANAGGSGLVQGGASTGGNPWASGKDEKQGGDLSRPQCLEIQRPPKTGGYIGDLKVYNKCDEPISYSYCYRGGGRSSWKLFECRPDAQGRLSKGSSDIAPGDTAVLPETLSSTTVDLAVCKKGALPFITNVNGRQSSFVCQ